MILYRRSRKLIIELINEEIFWPVNYVDENTKFKRLNIYNLSTKIYKSILFVNFLAFIGVYLPPIIIKTQNIPYIPNGISMSNKFFHVILVSFAFVILCFIQGIDGIFYGFLVTVYCQMIMLKDKIEKTNTEGMNEVEKFHMIAIFSNYYSKIIVYFKKIIKVFSLYTINRSIILICICSTFLFMIAVENNTERKVMCGLRIISYTWHFFLLCSVITAAIDQV